MQKLSGIPTKARALTALGDATAKAVYELFHPDQPGLFPQDEDDPDFEVLATALRRKHWSDEESAELIHTYGMRRERNLQVDLKAIIRWVLAHDDRVPARSIIDCMEVEPPDQVDIIRVLSRKGSQKLVFLATWRLRQQEVVLKKVLGGRESVEQVLGRELQPHPLSMNHRNIIETHILKNRSGEVFLVERRLHDVLSDSWHARGVQDAANLIFDIASALKFLHDKYLVHGDVKPDNIGLWGDRFVLLDFGICRSVDEFSKETTPTGSIRTRAPELLISGRYVHPPKADVWALGAVIFNAFVGRFPLVREDEDIPRVSSPEDRNKFEDMLARRARDEWSDFVTSEKIPEPLRPIVERMLTSDVQTRIGAADLVKIAGDELSAFLRSPGSLGVRFSPIEEFAQISSFLASARNLNLLPPNRRRQIGERLSDLKAVTGFDPEKRDRIEQLMALLR